MLKNRAFPYVTSIALKARECSSTTPLWSTCSSHSVLLTLPWMHPAQVHLCDFAMTFLSAWKNLTPTFSIPPSSRSLLKSSTPISASSSWPHQLLSLLCFLASYLFLSTSIYYIIPYLLDPPLEFKCHMGRILPAMFTWYRTQKNP